MNSLCSKSHINASQNQTLSTNSPFTTTFYDYGRVLGPITSHPFTYPTHFLCSFRKYGVDAELLSRAQIKTKFPWLNVDDIELGSYGKSWIWMPRVQSFCYHKVFNDWITLSWKWNITCKHFVHILWCTRGPGSPSISCHPAITGTRLLSRFF